MTIVYILVSSAKSTNFSSFETLQISLIYRRNNWGPRIEPWGTPQEIFNKSGLKLLI